MDFSMIEIFMNKLKCRIYASLFDKYMHEARALFYHNVPTEMEKKELCDRFLNDVSQFPCTQSIESNYMSKMTVIILIKNSTSPQSIIEALRGCSINCQCGIKPNVLDEDNQGTENDDSILEDETQENNVIQETVIDVRNSI